MLEGGLVEGSGQKQYHGHFISIIIYMYSAVHAREDMTNSRWGPKQGFHKGRGTGIGF